MRGRLPAVALIDLSAAQGTRMPTERTRYDPAGNALGGGARAADEGMSIAGSCNHAHVVHGEVPMGFECLVGILDCLRVALDVHVRGGRPCNLRCCHGSRRDGRMKWWEGAGGRDPMNDLIALET